MSSHRLLHICHCTHRSIRIIRFATVPMVNMRSGVYKNLITANIISKRYFAVFTDGTREDDVQRRAKLAARGLPERRPIPGVKRIVLVASGKGGVGKTTTAVNLACAMKIVNPSENIGLLDADVFGPSVPLMMNLSGEPMLNSDNLMEPLLNYGIKCMSMGLLVSGEGAAIWRGLMVMRALDRLTRQVAWGPLDCLVVDTPPGTGDTHLSLAQNLPVDGAVLVTTPQTAALRVARRGATMLEKLKIPIFGIVENMSHTVCERCGSRNRVFGRGTDHLASQLELPILESFRLDRAVSDSTTTGKPVVLSEPDGEHAQRYKNLASRVHDLLLDGVRREK